MDGLISQIINKEILAFLLSSVNILVNG